MKKRCGPLPITYIKVVTLAYLGFAPQHIARILGISRQSAKVQIYRARHEGILVDEWFPRGREWGSKYPRRKRHEPRQVSQHPRAPHQQAHRYGE